MRHLIIRLLRWALRRLDYDTELARDAIERGDGDGQEWICSVKFDQVCGDTNNRRSVVYPTCGSAIDYQKKIDAVFGKLKV